MGTVHPVLDEQLRAFIARQSVFFVATAPLDGEGHVNVSPKGYAGTLRVVDDSTLAYLDLTASGVETIAHLRENGRITLMWCAFDDPPTILRVHGRGRVVLPEDPDWDHWSRLFDDYPGARAVVVVTARRISDSCGFGVPYLTLTGERDTLLRHNERTGADALHEYRRRRNAVSLDGLPGLPAGEGDPVPSATPSGPARPETATAPGPA